MLYRNYSKDYWLDCTFMIISNELPYHKISDYWEFPIIYEGSVLHKINGREEKLEVGDCYLIPPNTDHSYSLCEGKYSIINIMITDTGLQDLISVLNPSIYEYITGYNSNIKLSLSNNAVDDFLKTVYKIQNSYHDNPETFNVFLKLMWMDAIKHIYQHQLNTKATYPSWLNNFLTTIKSPQNLTLNVDELYQLTHFSHSHLNKLFKRYTGQTLKNYMLHLKMNHAAKLLQTTNRKILDIAVEVGYSSLSHFNKVFKSTYHTTPTAYRNGGRE